MKASSPHHLLIGMLSGIVLGILLGGLAPSIGLSIAFIGDLFLQALFALVVPLVMSSMIVGIASLGDVRQLGSIGLRTILFFMTTTGLAVLVGLILVIVIHPGTPTEQASPDTPTGQTTSLSERMEDKPTTLGD
ncbi:MAG TPA: cation:dicarboxylase symporter family transporter, partial [Nitrospirales bacterium]|nr:cation:dicarboxylase symporter family transporter [Nitrospirales bacterium]